MKQIELIDLLIKLANHEEVPKRICFERQDYTYDENERRYKDMYGNYMGNARALECYLHEEVDILEGSDKE